MTFSSSLPSPPHQSMGSSPQVHTSIDVGHFDSLVDQHYDSSEGQDSLSFAFSPPVATAFRAMEPQNQYQTQMELHRRANRATTLSIPSPSASFPSNHSVASSASFVFSNNSILMNSLGSSPGSSELDFTGVPYVENNTPVGPPATKAAPSPRRRRSRVTSGVRSPSFTQETREMDRERLTQLRNYLIRSSNVVVDHMPSPRFVPIASPSPRLDSIDGDYEDSEESSFVGVLPTPELIRARSGPRYIEATGRGSSAPTEVSMLSSTNTHPGEFLGVMPLPTPSRMPQHAPPRPTNSHAMPRESVAVLIDAVRASTLPEDEKCRFIFDHFDVTKRGVLSREGVTAFVEATLVANNMHCYGDFNVSKMVDKLFEDKQQMTYSEFRAAFGHAIFKSTPVKHTSGEPVKPTAPRPTGRVPQHAQRREEEDGPGSDHCTLRQLDDTPRMSDCSPPVYFRQSSVGHKKQSKVLRNYRKYQDEIHWVVIYTLVLVAAFAVKASTVHYDPAVGAAAKVAKGFAQVIMVDALFLLLPMCRNLVTYLRKFASVTSHVPVDRNIDFHKICGVVMLLAALGHTVAWVMIIHYLRSVPDELWQQSKYARLAFLRDETPMQLAQRLPIWTGFLMLLIAAVAAPLTHPAIRRGNFNVFWLTHLMFVPFLLLILAHGMAMWVQPPQASYWILPPCLLYFADKRYRMSKIFGGKTSIQRVQFSQDTVAVFMKKPAKFHFHPGMYLYLNVPAISRFEWHPFTISSAPEDDCLSVHIRKAGDWTGALHTLLKAAKDQNEAAGGADLEAGSPYPPVYIDGPIGAPSQEYYRYKSVVFVGAGIGVTPFASILRSIVHQWQAFRCPCCESVTFPREFQIQKIYFYWITREQESLTWFTETMNQLSALDTEGRLEIHNYFSPLKNEAVTAPLRALQTFIHDAEGQDIISGLATKQVTHFGRPDWKQELQRIAQNQQERTLLDQQLELEQLERQEGNGQLSSRLNLRVARLKQHEKPPVEDVAVFFCGPRPMGSTIHDECAKFNQDKSRTCGSVAFDFHSEVF